MREQARQGSVGFVLVADDLGTGIGEELSAVPAIIASGLVIAGVVGSLVFVGLLILIGFLVRNGVEFPCNRYGAYVGYKTDHDPRQRATSAGPKTSMQMVQQLLADSAMKVEAARQLVYEAARHIDAGTPDGGRFAAMAKCFATDVAMEVTTNAVQVFGGYGYVKEYHVERLMRDAKIIQIYEGTNQILRNDMISHLLKRKGRRD